MRIHPTALIVAGCVLGLLAGLIALAGREPAAAGLFAVMWSFALGFIEPRRAWLWPLLLFAWAPLGALTHLLPALPIGMAWCSHGTFSPWQTVLGVLAGCYVFALAGALAAVLLNFAVARGPWRDLAALKLIKPALEIGGSALAIVLVVYAGLAMAQPLHPFGPGERYCWDEFCFRVTHVDRAKAIGTGLNRASSHGTFYVVTAQMETPWWGRFDWSPEAVYVVDYEGARYEHSVAGQRAQDALSGRSSACHQIPGAAEIETIVFDLPDNVVQPRLLVRDTLGFGAFMGGLRLDHGYVKPAFNLRYD